MSGTAVLTPSGEQPIERLRVGQRVLTYAPDEAVSKRQPANELDPATTRCITLTLGEDPHHPGRPLTKVRLLRDASWVEENQLEVGGTVPLHLSELGVKGQATVQQIEACPELEEVAEGIDAEGTRLVTATFEHTLGYPVDLKLEGLDAPIGVTRHHQIYSEDRGGWVEVGKLETRERVRVAGDVFEVEYTHDRPQPEAVYNIEVDADHVYRITHAGVLVHNQSVCRLHHASSIEDIDNIGTSGVQLRLARDGNEFGRGFYTAPDPDLVASFARKRFKSPAVISFEFDPATLKSLNTLIFNGPDDRWVRFVTDVLSGHYNKIPHEYDLVIGPILGNKTGRSSIFRGHAPIAFGEQWSFHTQRAIDILNNAQMHQVLL